MLFTEIMQGINFVSSSLFFLATNCLLWNVNKVLYSSQVWLWYYIFKQTWTSCWKLCYFRNRHHQIASVAVVVKENGEALPTCFVHASDYPFTEPLSPVTRARIQLVGSSMKRSWRRSVGDNLGTQWSGYVTSHLHSFAFKLTPCSTTGEVFVFCAANSSENKIKANG